MPGWKEKRNAYCSASSPPQKIPSKQVFMTRIYDGIAFLHAWLLQCNGSSLRVWYVKKRSIPLVACHWYNPSFIATWTVVWDGRRDSETFLWLRIVRGFVFWLQLNKIKIAQSIQWRSFECSVDGTGFCLGIDGVGTLETGPSSQKGLVKKENLINFDFDPCK